MSEIEVKIRDDKAMLYTPYNPEFVKRIKKLCASYIHVPGKDLNYIFMEKLLQRILIQYGALPCCRYSGS